MRSYTAPITEENFSEAWKWIARKRRWSIKKELIRRVSVSIAQIVYFFLFLILTFGVFYEMGGSFVRIYINQIPQAGIWWNQLSAPILADASTETMRILRCAGILYCSLFYCTIPEPPSKPEIRSKMPGSFAPLPNTPRSMPRKRETTLPILVLSLWES